MLKGSVRVLVIFLGRVLVLMKSGVMSGLLGSSELSWGYDCQ